MTVSEVVSLAASVLVFVSYLFKDQRKLRKVNLIASILFIAYGFLLLFETQWHSGYSIIVLNVGTTLMHFFYLLSGARKDSDTKGTKDEDKPSNRE